MNATQPRSELLERITAPTVMRFFVLLRRQISGILAIMAFAAPAMAQQVPPVGVIDFYGLRKLQPADLAAALSLQIGDTINPRVNLKQRLRSVPGVADAELNLVCCDAGRSILYVGIREDGVAPFTFGAPPTGSAHLPADVVANGKAFMDALVQGITRGQSGEDDSLGYSLALYPPARAAQQKLVAYAHDHFDVLQNVLRTSADSTQRELAAQVIAYAPERAAVAQELVQAVYDPAPAVRNNAMRALAVMAVYKQKHPDASYDVPFAPFISYLNSLSWTDRNKAAFALTALTEARDPALLQLLRDSALDALVEMAHWKAIGHAAAAGMILGRMAGLPEDSIFPLFQRDRGAVIRAAQSTRDAAAAPSRGRVELFQIHSNTYQTDRRIWVYTPAAYNAHAAPYALIVAFDGSDYLDSIPLPLMLDTLIASRNIAPAVAVLIDDYDGAQRTAELGNSARFARFMGSELMPWVQQHFNVTHDPHRTTITGSSAGGLAAAFVALERPDLFGNVFAQSGAFWRGAEGASGAPFEWLTAQVAARPKEDIRFMVDVGSTENHAVIGGAGPVFIGAVQRFRDALVKKGYDVIYTEIPGGVHAPATWRLRLPVGLVQLAGHR